MTTIEYRLRDFFGQHHLSRSTSYCYGCSSCVSVCPISNVTDGAYNPRDILNTAIIGVPILDNPTINSVWDCTMCFSCEAVCPQSLELTELFVLLRNILAKEYGAPSGYSDEYEKVKTHALSVPRQDMVCRRRKQMGLKESPGTNVEEVQKLIQIVEDED